MRELLNCYRSWWLDGAVESSRFHFVDVWPRHPRWASNLLHYLDPKPKQGVIAQQNKADYGLNRQKNDEFEERNSCLTNAEHWILYQKIELPLVHVG